MKENHSKQFPRSSTSLNQVQMLGLFEHRTVQIVQKLTDVTRRKELTSLGWFQRVKHALIPENRCFSNVYLALGFEGSLLKFHLKKNLSCILWKPRAHSKATNQVLDGLLLLRDDVLYLSAVLYLIYTMYYIYYISLLLISNGFITS